MRVPLGYATRELIVDEVVRGKDIARWMAPYGYAGLGPHVEFTMGEDVVAGTLLIVGPDGKLVRFGNADRG